MYILGTYMYENPVLVHTKYILFICFRTDMYKYILGMYWYEHFRRVSSRVSGFQMIIVGLDYDIRVIFNTSIIPMIS